MKKCHLLLPVLALLSFPSLAADDARVAVAMPDTMKSHMLANMRDHLLTLHEMQNALAAGKYDVAAEVAENRLGMTSLKSHGAQHMAGMMPQAMQEIGSNMHRAASRFAVVAQDTAIDKNLPRALQAMSQITQNCVACHAGFRLQ